MTNNIHEQYFSPSDAAQRARIVWDAIQAAELPESEKAKNEAVSQCLKEIARRALEVSNNTAKWFAIDLNGQIYAYRSCPYIKEDHWHCIDNNTHFVSTFDTPLNWSIAWKSARYEISQILSDDVQ